MDRLTRQARMRRLFTEGFAAIDIAEPLYSVDGVRESRVAARWMDESGLDLVGVRRNGVVVGYARRENLANGSCLDHVESFYENQILPESGNLADAILMLEKYSYCFIAMLGHVGAYVSLREVHKPPVRMWLFGMITILETYITRIIREKYPDDSWQQMVSAGRLGKARALFEERLRRKERVQLLDCLQFGEKGRILLNDPHIREDVGFASIREGKQRLKEIESLRNNLAHSQDIVGSNWSMIVGLSRRLETIMTRI